MPTQLKLLEAHFDERLARMRDSLLPAAAWTLDCENALSERRADPLEALATGLMRFATEAQALARVALETSGLAVEVPQFVDAAEPAIETLRREAQFCREGI